jgi:ABC-type sulfate transport system substrate-binding protein
MWGVSVWECFPFRVGGTYFGGTYFGTYSWPAPIRGRFEKSAAGAKKAREAVQNTLESADSRTEFFTNRNGDVVMDIYSEETGMIVRVRKDGTFDTLIPEKSTRIKNAETGD